MGSGKSFRREDKRAIPRGPGNQDAIASRQAEGRNKKQEVPEWKWITGEAELVQACLDMLNGEPGLYPMFGIQMAVEERQGNTENYSVLVYCDALYGEEGQNLCGALRPGFAVGVHQLAWNINEGTKWKSADHELFILAILVQPEMQMARQKFFEEQQAAEEERKRRTQEAQAQKPALIARLRSQLIQPKATDPVAEPAEEARSQCRQKPEYPEVAHISKLITNDDICVFYHPSGATLKTCEGEKKQLVVRISGLKDETHPMFRASQLNVFAFLDEIVEEPENPQLDTEMQREGQTFRAWLREQGILNDRIPQGEPSGNVVGTVVECSAS